MKTELFRHKDTGTLVSFAIENAYINTRTIASLLSQIDGVTQLRRRRLFGNWEGDHVRFLYRGAEYVVHEPYGDSSEYSIEAKHETDALDIGAIHQVFDNYQPPLLRQIIGDIVSLRIPGVGK